MSPLLPPSRRPSPHRPIICTHFRSITFRRNKIVLCVFFKRAFIWPLSTLKRRERKRERRGERKEEKERLFKCLTVRLPTGSMTRGCPALPKVQAQGPLGHWTLGLATCPPFLEKFFFSSRRALLTGSDLTALEDSIWTHRQRIIWLWIAKPATKNVTCQKVG